MRLLARLLLGIAAIVAVCLSLATALILRDTHARLVQATEASAARASRALGALYWQELVWRDGLNRAELLPLPDWRTLATARVVSPGICVAFVPKGAAAEAMAPLPPLCSLAEEDFPPAPAWFDALYARFYGGLPEARRAIDTRQDVGVIVAAADPGTALRVAWLEVGLMMRRSAILALAIGLGVALLVVRMLTPVGRIIAAMRALEAGDYTGRVARPGGSEFGQIARAVDLHDEFGQCLAAAGALAGSIEAGAADRISLQMRKRSLRRRVG